MQTAQPFLLDDINDIRKSIVQLEKQLGKKAELWRLLTTSARNAPFGFGWYTPFVALITREKQDIENVRAIILTYIDKLEPMSFCSGLQFHFWCFAFPHAKMAIYFQWLCTIGAFTTQEQDEIAARFIDYHFVNFYYGMRSKPEPECVDNQVLSLCLSNTIIGALFTQGENASARAKLMLRDGLRRIPDVIGTMPRSGYSGEGSSYMDCVNGPAIPLAVEVLEQIGSQKNLLFSEFAPNHVKPIQVLRMVAREFMPGGLLLPWDNYGYQFGVRSSLAYAANKTGERLFYDALEKECNWTYDIGIGWAYDDLVWTLLWWPGEAPASSEDGRNWYEPETGAALVNEDLTRYAVQMWDESEPEIPTRLHANPNAVLFNAYGIPLSADGSPTPDAAHSFQFEDTWRSVSFLAIDTESRYNYGDGCCGAHSCVVVDGLESMRAHTDAPQTQSSGYSSAEKSVWADVTPIYTQNFADITCVKRKTQLHHEAFFTVEDLILANQAHTFSSRFVLRPFLKPASKGVKMATPEGVTLHIVDVLQANELSSKTIENHPFKPDGGSVVVDFSAAGKKVQRLFVALPSRTLRHKCQLMGFAVVGDEQSCLQYATAYPLLKSSNLKLAAKLPPFMEASLPNWRTWWYHKDIHLQDIPTWLVLPAGMHNPRLFLDGAELDLSPWKISGELIPPHIPLPQATHEGQLLEMVLRVEVSVGHYDGGGDGTVSMTGGIWLAEGVEEEKLLDATYNGQELFVETTKTQYRVPYTLLQEEEKE